MEWQLRDASPRTATWLLVTAGDAATADAAVRAGADMLDVGPAGPAAIGDILERHPDVPLWRAWPPADLDGNAIRARPPGIRLICADVRAATAALDAGVPRAAILLATRPPGVAAALAAGWDVLADVDDPLPGASGILAGQAPTVGHITPQQQNAAAAAGEVPRGRVEFSAGSAENSTRLPYLMGTDADEAGAGTVDGDGQARDGEDAAARAGDANGVNADEVNAAVAAAAVCAWMGAAAVRTRHVRPVRRALDMTASIRGLRPPAWAVRGLA